MAKFELVTLRIYRASRGQWGGRLYTNGEEIAAIARCASPQAVEEGAREGGFYPVPVQARERVGLALSNAGATDVAQLERLNQRDTNRSSDG